MITLYGAPGSAYVRKVKVFLLEKSMDFEENPISPLGNPLPDSFLAISPLGKIPAITDGDFHISDSSVICSYIDRQYPTEMALMPKQAKSYAKILWFEEWADTKLFTSLAPFYYQAVLVPLYYQRAPDEEKIKLAKINIHAVNNYLEASLGDNDYLVDNRFSLADIAVACVYFNMHHAGFSIDDYCSSKVCSYLYSIFERQSFKACVKDMLVDVTKSKLIRKNLIVSRESI